ncbi:flagellar FlbD family protein [Sporosarcina sp. HYO08]|uniref:flagellar FlbD family protein n=1 Tax=Sporosarcina sp. HYO08 TaxID=1759557 RepID=UPI00079A8651|nr:flagellar FlbD family protein [Sporosarcina sp. HYO08]KXH79987.1 hypothetical protein AU377_10970 [Sporosarcina sp. HYO08]
MIKVTRLNGTTFTLNALYIETIESLPDTTITLTNGKKYIARDSAKKINERVLAFYRSVHLLGVDPPVRGDSHEE